MPLRKNGTEEIHINLTLKNIQYSRIIVKAQDTKISNYLRIRYVPGAADSVGIYLFYFLYIGTRTAHSYLFLRSKSQSYDVSVKVCVIENARVILQQCIHIQQCGMISIWSSIWNAFTQSVQVCRLILTGFHCF